LSHQKEYELFLKNAFRKADENNSGYLSLAEVSLQFMQLHPFVL
jgi:hypothetical protein